MEETKKRLYTVREACSLLGVHPNTLRRWDREGKIKVVRHEKGHRRVPESEITRWLAKSPAPAQVSSPSPQDTPQENLRSSFLNYVFSYNRDDWELVKRAILIRDDHTCTKCGGKELLDVHHKDGTSRNDPDNLITLCKKCHDKIHGGAMEPKKRKIEPKTQIKPLEKTETETKPKITPEKKEIPRTTIIDELAPSRLTERTAFGGLLSAAIALKNFTFDELAAKARCPTPIAKTFCDKMGRQGYFLDKDGRYEMLVKVV